MGVRRTGSTGRGRGLRIGVLLAGALAAIAMLAPAGPAQAASSICTEPDGTQFRVDWTRNGSGFTYVTDLKIKGPGQGSFSTFDDTWGSVSKLEWWTADSWNGLVAQTSSVWNHPAVTLFGSQSSYEQWYGSADQRPNVLGQPVYPFLSPRVSHRDNGSGLVRTADKCDTFLSDWPTGSGPRTAITGDSITVQMTKKLLDMAYWRPFVEPQSGMSYHSMRGEIRGLAAGLREPATGAQTKPDVLVLALGTNDAGRIAGGNSPTAREWLLAEFALNLEEALDGSAGVQCRVLTTVHETGYTGNPNQPYRPELLQARRDVNELIRDAAASHPGVRLMDWAEISAGHEGYASDNWYTPPDFTHPNATGLTHMSNEIRSAALNCD